MSLSRHLRDLVSSEKRFGSLRCTQIGSGGAGGGGEGEEERGGTSPSFLGRFSPEGQPLVELASMLATGLSMVLKCGKEVWKVLEIML